MSLFEKNLYNLDLGMPEEVKGVIKKAMETRQEQFLKALTQGKIDEGMTKEEADSYARLIDYGGYQVGLLLYLRVLHPELDVPLNIVCSSVGHRIEGILADIFGLLPELNTSFRKEFRKEIMDFADTCLSLCDRDGSIVNVVNDDDTDPQDSQENET